MADLSTAAWPIVMLGFGPATIALGYAMRGLVDSGPVLLVGTLITICVDGTYFAVIMCFWMR